MQLRPLEVDDRWRLSSIILAKRNSGRLCRIYTVISGVFYIGLGDEFDADKLQAYPPGAVIVLPANTSHFHWAKSGEYITQVTAIGPLGLEYVNASDDPRTNNGQFMTAKRRLLDSASRR